MQITRAKFISLIFLAPMCLSGIIISANAPKTREKNIRRGCRQKKISRTYPIIKTNKNRPGNSKYLKGPKKRNYSFTI
jgi:hypothetical protein